MYIYIYTGHTKILIIILLLYYIICSRLTSYIFSMQLFLSLYYRFLISYLISCVLCNNYKC